MTRRYVDPKGVVHVAIDTGRYDLRVAVCSAYMRLYPTWVLTPTPQPFTTCLACLAHAVNV